MIDLKYELMMDIFFRDIYSIKYSFQVDDINAKPNMFGQVKGLRLVLNSLQNSLIKQSILQKQN